MKVEIKSRFDGRVLFSGEYATVKDAVVAAVKERAYLRSAYLRSADLRSAYLGGADLGGADLGSAYLGGAYLGGADLGSAYLGGAYLGGAYLGGANLGDADLRSAYLRSAYLRSANLRGAHLSGANLGDTKIRAGSAVVQIGPIGSRSDMMIVFNTEDGLRVRTGCFYGAADDFLARVMETHGTNKHATNYRNALELAASMMGAHDPPRAHRPPRGEGGGMSANHEPGPWVIQRPRPCQNRIFVRPKFGVGVAIAQICQRTNRDANAALIAAAPEMYEALRDLLAAKPNSDAAEWVAARAAIAKAEGRQ